jgi:carbonic anhydrase
MGRHNPPRAALAVLATLLAFGGLRAGWTDVPEQAPIDIRTTDVIKAQLPKLRFQYAPTTRLTLINTGSPDEHATIRADVPAGAGDLVIGPSTYRLLQFHWHVPAEHRVDGRLYPMELHLVHQSENGKLAVVGVFIEEGKPVPDLEKIFRRLPPDKSHAEPVPAFSLSSLLPPHRKSYRYFGSLTTPPFTEGVRWAVLAEPISLSHAQIEAFRRLFHEGNSRDVQPLLNRVVLTELPKNR